MPVGHLPSTGIHCLASGAVRRAKLGKQTRLRPTSNFATSSSMLTAQWLESQDGRRARQKVLRQITSSEGQMALRSKWNRRKPLESGVRGCRETLPPSPRDFTGGL